MARSLPPEDRLRYLRVIADHSEPIDMLGFAMLMLFISVFVIIYLARNEGLEWALPSVLLANLPAVLFWVHHCRHREFSAELMRTYKQIPDEELAALYEQSRHRANGRLLMIGAVVVAIMLWLLASGNGAALIAMLIG